MILNTKRKPINLLIDGLSKSYYEISRQHHWVGFSNKKSETGRVIIFPPI
jgi:hypothetical protein